jgi:hypothetical protein
MDLDVNLSPLYNLSVHLSYILVPFNFLYDYNTGAKFPKPIRLLELKRRFPILRLFFFCNISYIIE